MLKVGRKLFQASYVLQNIFENPIGIPERQELFAGLNVCSICNKGAGAKEQVVQNNLDVPSIYVGESRRSIKERGGEHWTSYKSKAQDSHILKHQTNHHPGKEPKLILRVSSFHKSALEQQVTEAVRIRRRGSQGAVSNSKSEFDRCKIPRLVLEEPDLGQTSRMEQIRTEEMNIDLDREQPHPSVTKYMTQD